MSKAQIPNALTVVRILLVPLMVAALLLQTTTGDVLAGIAFSLASWTDFFDGWLARRSGNVTTFGKLADPIADKLLTAAALITLVSLDRLALWVAVVVIGRELLVTIVRGVAASQGDVISAAWLGKIKTTIQGFVILFLILIDPSPWWVDLGVYAMVAITLISAGDFFLSMARSRSATDPTR